MQQPSKMGMCVTPKLHKHVLLECLPSTSEKGKIQVSLFLVIFVPQFDVKCPFFGDLPLFCL
jgi:hypothetical protein